MEYLHTMVRVTDLAASIDFYVNTLGFVEIRRSTNNSMKNTRILLAAPDDVSQAKERKAPLLELTHYWNAASHRNAESFGHIAYRVQDIYGVCQRLVNQGYTIHRPPRDGYLAYIKSPDDITIELLQSGEPALPLQPWASMSDIGEW